VFIFVRYAQSLRASLSEHLRKRVVLHQEIIWNQRQRRERLYCLWFL